MATYTELRGVFGDGALISKVEVAVTIAANAVLSEVTPVSGRRAWAEAAMLNTGSEAMLMWKYMIAANAAVPVGSITGASDATILAAVNASVDKRFGAAL